MKQYLIKSYKVIGFCGFLSMIVTPIIYIIIHGGNAEGYTMFNYGILFGCILLGISVYGKLQDDKIKGLNKVKGNT